MITMIIGEPFRLDTVCCTGFPLFFGLIELLGPNAIMAQAFEHLKWQSRLMLLASLKEPYNGAAAPWTRKLCQS